MHCRFTPRATLTDRTPLFALFVLAMFIPVANGLGAGIGALYGFSTAIAVAYWQQFTGMTPLSFMWIGITALIVNVSVGTAASWLAPTRQRTGVRLGIVGVFVAGWVACWFVILVIL